MRAASRSQPPPPISSKPMCASAGPADRGAGKLEIARRWLAQKAARPQRSLALERRLGAARVPPASTLDRVTFSAEFGRNLEYYTGFVFEVLATSLGPATPVAGGGRYDQLMRAVGAPADVPAVGAAIHTERCSLSPTGSAVSIGGADIGAQADPRRSVQGPPDGADDRDVRSVSGR